MKRSFAPLLFVTAFLTLCAQAFATTWYVRSDGGTRYSANRVSSGLSTQCNGQFDAPYSGDGGSNENCAFNDVRFLWDDQATYGQLNWVIAGGDTVILDNTKQWRIGWDTDNGQNEPWCIGWSQGPYGCFNPAIPAGTAAQPTRILGRNYAACNAGNVADPTKVTQMFGGHGTGTVLNLADTQNVQVECVELTRHSDCMVHGYPAYPSACGVTTADGGLQDYDSNGIQTNDKTANILLQDIWDHGHVNRGIIGPIGGTINVNRVDISTNGMAGWDFDDGSSTPSVNGLLQGHYLTVEWSGCNQEYPAASATPVASCYDQDSGGYGDGIGTPVGTGLSVNLDHAIFRYNTQDGPDFGHVDTGTFTLTMTDSASYGNMGSIFKWGPAFGNVTLENNIGVGNCLRMQAPMTGVPSTYNTYLGDFCRAGDGVSFETYNNQTTTIANNTFVSYAPTTVDLQCVGSNNNAANCASTVINFTNNIFRLYDDPNSYSFGGQAGGPGMYCGAGCNSSTALLGTINRYNNVYYGFRGGCMAGQAVGSTGGVISKESCTDAYFQNEPASFTNEAMFDGYNFALASQSPLVASGVPVAGLTQDFDSNAWKNPPSVGALETGSVDVLNATGAAWPVTAPPVSSPVETAPIVAAPTAVMTTTTVTGQPYKREFQNVTLIATVKASSGSAVPTGTVTLSALGVKLATASLKNGTASWTYPAIVETVGFSVSYQASSPFLASTSTALIIAPTTKYK